MLFIFGWTLPIPTPNCLLLPLVCFLNYSSLPHALTSPWVNELALQDMESRPGHMCTAVCIQCPGLSQSGQAVISMAVCQGVSGDAGFCLLWSSPRWPWPLTPPTSCLQHQSPKALICPVIQVLLAQLSPSEMLPFAPPYGACFLFLSRNLWMSIWLPEWLGWGGGGFAWQLVVCHPWEL